MIWFARRERSHVQRRVVPPAVVLRGHEDNDWVPREEGARTRLVADSFLASRGVVLATRVLGSMRRVLTTRSWRATDA